MGLFHQRAEEGVKMQMPMMSVGRRNGEDDKSGLQPFNDETRRD